MSSRGLIEGDEDLPSLSLLPSLSVGEEETPVSESYEPGPMVRRVADGTRIPAPETNLSELTFDDLDLMPVRCYSCAKVIRQRAIQDALRSGKTLLQTFQELNYRKLCCRKLIQAQRSIVKLQKQFEHNAQIGHALERGLTLDATSANSFSIGPSMGPSKIRILDEVPPEFTSDFISLGGIGEGLMQDEEGILNPYNYLMQGLEHTEAYEED